MRAAADGNGDGIGDFEGLTHPHDYIPHHFSVALKLISLGIVRVAPLITHRFDLGAVREAFELAAGRGGLKAMVLPVG